MRGFLKKRKEVIFFSASLLLLLIVMLYAFRSIRFLVLHMSDAVDPHDVRLEQAPVQFNLDQFERLELNSNK